MHNRNTTHPEQPPAGQTAQRQKEHRHNTPAGCAGGANTEIEHRNITKPTKKNTNNTMINNLPRLHSPHHACASGRGTPDRTRTPGGERSPGAERRAGERSGCVRVEGGRGFGRSPTNPKKVLTLTEFVSQNVTKIAGVVDRSGSVYAQTAGVSAVWRCAKTLKCSALP